MYEKVYSANGIEVWLCIVAGDKIDHYVVVDPGNPDAIYEQSGYAPDGKEAMLLVPVVFWNYYRHLDGEVPC